MGFISRDGIRNPPRFLTLSPYITVKSGASEISQTFLEHQGCVCSVMGGAGEAEMMMKEAASLSFRAQQRCSLLFHSSPEVISQDFFAFAIFCSPFFPCADSTSFHLGGLCSFLSLLCHHCHHPPCSCSLQFSVFLSHVDSPWPFM